ncbi:hypothetical protein OAG71_04610 [bacterium]|nr:hypothetical protein [bacterium]
MTITGEKLDDLPAVAEIDWTNVRLVYKKMQDDFWLITSPFGIELDDQTCLYLAHLIGTIDSIDRTLDELPDLKQRVGFSQSLTDYLSGRTKTIESEFTSPEVNRRMENLRSAIILQDVQHEFCQTVTRVFAHTEAKRSATTEQKMISEMREEWRLTGRLTVLIMGAKTTADFEKFFYLCCEMMTAVDMIQDARDDYRNGQISVPPRISLYLRLMGEFLFPMPKLIWRFPRPLNLFRYTFSFLFHVYGPFRTD